MNARHIRQCFDHVLILVALLCLSACGIDQGGVQDPVPQTSQTTVVSGPITGFGSVILNGLTLNSAAAQVLVDGVPANEADLRAGQVVRAIAIDKGTSIDAVLIEYQENLVGTIDALDIPNNTLRVLEQTVATNSQTRFDIAQVNALADLQPGQRVVISGLPKPDGELLATYIGSAAATDPFEITASITGLGQAALTFELGNLTVDYSQAMLLDLLTGMPELDLVVEVSGTRTGPVFMADQVRALPRLPGSFDMAALSLTDAESPIIASPAVNNEFAANFIGFVAANNLPGSILVADIEVFVGADTVIVGGTGNDLQPGTRIQIEGINTNSGQFQAERITVL